MSSFAEMLFMMGAETAGIALDWWRIRRQMRKALEDSLETEDGQEEAVAGEERTGAEPPGEA